MAKRKGSSASRPRARSEVAKGGSEAKGAFEDECDKLEREINALEGEHAEVEEKRNELEELLRPLIRKEEQLRQSLLTKKRRIGEVKNARRLDKLPEEVWDKILDNLDENDLFPLALSCRYFRQKQKEQVARTRQQEPVSGKSPLALKTTFRRNLFPAKLVWPGPGPASADYLRFCSKEKVSLQQYYGDGEEKRLTCLRVMAAYRGYLPLLQELTKTSEDWYYEREIADSANDVIRCAGESSSSQFLLLLGSASDCFLHFTVRGGQLETVRWLKTQDYHGLDGRLFRETCESGNLEMMKWLRSEGCL